MSFFKSKKMNGEYEIVKLKDEKSSDEFFDVIDSFRDCKTKKCVTYCGKVYYSDGIMFGPKPGTHRSETPEKTLQEKKEIPAIAFDLMRKAREILKPMYWEKWDKLVIEKLYEEGEHSILDFSLNVINLMKDNDTAMQAVKLVEKHEFDGNTKKEFIDIMCRVSDSGQRLVYYMRENNI